MAPPFSTAKKKNITKQKHSHAKNVDNTIFWLSQSWLSQSLLSTPSIHPD